MANAMPDRHTMPGWHHTTACSCVDCDAERAAGRATRCVFCGQLGADDTIRPGVRAHWFCALDHFDIDEMPEDVGAFDAEAAATAVFMSQAIAKMGEES